MQRNELTHTHCTGKINVKIHSGALHKYIYFLFFKGLLVRTINIMPDLPFLNIYYPFTNKRTSYTWTNIVSCFWTQTISLLNKLATCIRAWLYQPRCNVKCDLKPAYLHNLQAKSTAKLVQRLKITRLLCTINKKKFV